MNIIGLNFLILDEISITGFQIFLTTVEILISLLIVFFSFKKKYLTSGGSFLTFIFAVVLFVFGGIKWITPIFVFFILSSILSKFNYQKNVFQSADEKNSVRDFKQVAANGLIPVLILLFNFILSWDFQACQEKVLLLLDEYFI